MMILMFFFVPLDMMFTAFLFEVAVNGAVHLYEVHSCLKLLLSEYPRPRPFAHLSWRRALPMRIKKTIPLGCPIACTSKQDRKVDNVLLKLSFARRR